MDSNKKQNHAEKDTLELVLKEILDEQKETNKINSGIIEALNHLSAKISSFDEKLENIELPAPQIDTRAIREIIEKGLIDLRLLVDSKLNKFRESNWRIFLQSDAKKWAVILIIAIVLLTYLYCFLKYYIQKP